MKTASDGGDTGARPTIRVVQGPIVVVHAPLPMQPFPAAPGPDPAPRTVTAAPAPAATGQKLPDSVLKHLPPITIIGGPGQPPVVGAATDENGKVIGPTINAADLNTGAPTDVNEGQWTSGDLKLPDYNLFSALLRSIPMDPPVSDDDIAAMWGDPDHPAPDTRSPTGDEWIKPAYIFTLDAPNGHRKSLSRMNAEIAKARGLTPAQWMWEYGIKARRSYRGVTPVGKSKADADKQAADAKAAADKVAADKLAADTAAALKKLASGAGTGGLGGQGLPVAQKPSMNTALVVVGGGLAAYLVYSLSR